MNSLKIFLQVTWIMETFLEKWNIFKSTSQKHHNIHVLRTLYYSTYSTVYYMYMYIILQYNTVQCTMYIILQYIQYSVLHVHVHYITVQYSTVYYMYMYIILQYNTVQCTICTCTLYYSTIQYSVLHVHVHYTIQYSVLHVHVHYITVQYNTVCYMYMYIIH